MCPGWRCLVGSWRPVIRSGFYVLGPELEAEAENREADVDLCGQIAAEAVVWLLGQVAARAYGQFYCPLWSGIIHLYIESPKTHRRKPHLLCRVYRALHTPRQTSFWAFPPAVSAASTRMDTHSSCATNPAAAELLHPKAGRVFLAPCLPARCPQPEPLSIASSMEVALKSPPPPCFPQTLFLHHPALPCSRWFLPACSSDKLYEHSPGWEGSRCANGVCYPVVRSPVL